VILVVDDDKIALLIATRSLQDFDVTLVTAEDGAAGLRLAREMEPDLIITDALLPKLDGREMALLVKQDPALQNCKVVVMTALYKGIRYRNEAMKQFLVDEYIEKPLTATKLLAVAGRMLHRGIPQKMAAAS
jgi:two-component system alkaline phosphatase synthesis response regulator PhoP